MQLTAVPAPAARLGGVSRHSPAWSIAAHLVCVLLLVLVEGELPPVQAVGDFVGADVLGLAHTASTLGDDPTQPHLPQEVGLGRGGEHEWGAVRMGCTAPAPTSTTKLGWEGGLTLSIGTRRGADQGVVTSSG